MDYAVNCTPQVCRKETATTFDFKDRCCTLCWVALSMQVLLNIFDQVAIVQRHKEPNQQNNLIEALFRDIGRRLPSISQMQKPISMLCRFQVEGGRAF